MDSLPNCNDPLVNDAIARFDQLDTTDLLFETILHTFECDQAGKANERLALAMAASYAMNKVLYYLGALDRVDQERIGVGQEIARLRGRVGELREIDPGEAIRLDFLAFTLAGRQEVSWHVFTVCVSQIARLLPEAARGAGIELSEEDREYLETFKLLRNHFEHLDERLPGREKKGRLVVTQPDELRMVLGLQMDELGRVVVNGTAVDVTGRGVEAVRRIVGGTVEAIRAACLTQVRQRFAADPAQIPAPEAIGSGLRRTLP